MNKKIDYSLAPPEFDDVILVLQHSAETGKYGRNDWLNGKNFDSDSNMSSMKRHIRDYQLGIRQDKDNDLHPYLMVACRALMQYTLDKRNENLNSIKYKEIVKKDLKKSLSDISNLHQSTEQYKMHPQHCFCIECRDQYIRCGDSK